jgi:hypothetical protein
VIVRGHTRFKFRSCFYPKNHASVTQFLQTRKVVEDPDFELFDLERILIHPMTAYNDADDLEGYLFYLSGSDQSPAKVCGP